MSNLVDKPTLSEDEALSSRHPGQGLAVVPKLRREIIFGSLSKNPEKHPQSPYTPIP